MEKVKKIIDKSTQVLKEYFNITIAFLMRHEYLKIFIYLYILGLVMFASRTVFNSFTLPVNGDYILQQLPFHENGYDNVWHFFTTGEFVMWSYENFIGVNYFAANTFYYLTSPFFIPILLVPRSFIPQMIYLMMVFKLATGGLLFYILLKKFYKVSDSVSFIGATIYAFCGWGMYYLWFNHFADIIALFPLILIGVEYCLQKRKGWLLTIALFVMGCTNYFFLFTFAITTPLYAIFRAIPLYQGKGFKKGFSALWQTAWYYGAGILMAGVILIPALIVVSDTPRVAASNYYVETLLRYFFETVSKTGPSYVFGPLKSIGELFAFENLKGLFEHLFIFDEFKKFLYPIATFLYMNISDVNSLVFQTNGYENAVSSLFITTPLALLFWPAVFDAFKKKKVWTILGLIGVLIMLFSPITYYALHGFSTVAYARWQIFVVGLSIIFILKYLDTVKELPKIYLDIAVALNLGLAIYVAYYSNSIDSLDLQYRIYFVIGQVIYIAVAYIFLRFFYNQDPKAIQEKMNIFSRIPWLHKKEKKESIIKDDELSIIDKMFFHSKRKYSTLYFLIVIELLITANATLFYHGVKNYNELYGGPDTLTELHEVVDYIQSQDDGFYRIFNTSADRSYNNLQMNLHYNGLSTFHSVYNYQSQDFIDKSVIPYQGNWSMGVHEKRYNLETFLNVKYYIVKKGDNNIPLGYELFKEFENFEVYVNNDFIELGYAYDEVIDYNVFNSNSLLSAETNYWNRVGMYKEDLDEITPLLGNDITIAQKNDASTYQSISGRTFFLPRKNITDTMSDAEKQAINEQSEDVREKEVVTNNMNIFSNREELNAILEALPDDSYHKKDKLLGPWNNEAMNRNWDGDKFIFIPNQPIGANADGTLENGNNVLVRFHLGPNAEVRLYGGANRDQLLTADSHMIHYYNKDGDQKYYRGFYTTQPVTRIVIEFLNDHTFNSRLQVPTVTYEPYADYKERIDERKQFAFSDVSYTNNTLNFTTNYSTKKMVVLSVPYNEGWNISAVDADGNRLASPKLYNVDGGLLGFLSEAGEIHYHLNYVTPGLWNGFQLTMLGLVVLLILTLIYGKRKVTFMDHNGLIVAVVDVKYGDDALPPPMNERKGYRLVGWNKDLAMITHKKEVIALYDKKTYNVTFVNENGEVISMQKVQYLENAVPPLVENSEGSEFVEWDRDFHNIEADLVLHAIFKKKTHQVIFKDEDGDVISVQRIDHNETAIAPVLKAHNGHIFKGWSERFDAITKDLVITPIYEANLFIIHFESNGGTEVASYVDVQGNTTVELPLVEKTGYDFVGWFQGDSVNDQPFFNTTLVTSNITLYARWKKKEKESN